MGKNKFTEYSEQELWKLYKKDGSKAIKEELIVRYIPLVKHIVGKIMVNLPENFEFDDLVNYGIIGLIDAIDRFNLNYGTKFSTYAVPRVKGTIYDELRKIDWIPQSIRRKSKQLANIYIELENRLNRSPSDKEVREELGLSKKEFNKLLSEVSIPENISLDSFIAPQDNDKIKLKDIITASDEQKPGVVLEYKEMKRILTEAIDKLSEQEKTVISLYYYDDLTLTEIGEVLELTTARISQIHTKAIFRLRGFLSRKKKEFRE